MTNARPLACAVPFDLFRDLAVDHVHGLHLSFLKVALLDAGPNFQIGNPLRDLFFPPLEVGGAGFEVFQFFFERLDLGVVLAQIRVGVPFRPFAIPRRWFSP